MGEKRCYPRAKSPKQMRVTWQGAGRRMVSSVATVSLGGLFLHTPEPPPVGTMINLFFEVPGGEVRARAIVQRTEPDNGMGIEFVYMRQEDRARLAKLLKQHLLQLQAL